MLAAHLLIFGVMALAIRLSDAPMLYGGLALLVLVWIQALFAYEDYPSNKE
jgi:hypothetical protein